MKFRSLLAVLAAATFSAPALAQGPVILMGIDAEDGGPGAHGPVSAYASVISSGIVPNVANGGAGMLVIGGGKNAVDNVTQWWDAVSVATGIPVTYVNGAAAIAATSFNGFAMIGVASSEFQTFSGGLTNAENNAFSTRSGDIANHVNGGGGLFCLSQDSLNTPYGYLGVLGAFTFGFPAQFQAVTPTPAGAALGITPNVLDICCWHDEYLAFPGFLDVLVTNDATGNPCAIGGSDVVIVKGIALTPFNAQRAVGADHTVTANVANNLGNPIVDTLVDFEVLSGPHAGFTGQTLTDVSGEADFTYMGVSAGVDRIEACFTDGFGAVLCSNIVQVEWLGAGCFTLNFSTEDDLLTPLVDGQEVTLTGNFGKLVTIEGVPGSGLTAAIFDSNPAGPNAFSSDRDLLVGTGNILILQEVAGQTVPGVYDTPDDDATGGDITFLFLENSTLCSIDLIDIDLDPVLNQDTTVTLFDTTGRTRRFFVPGGWTEDLFVSGGAGIRTLDLRSLADQPGFVATATAVEDLGFDPSAVVSMVVHMNASGGIDNVAFETTQPFVTPTRGAPTKRRVRGGHQAPPTVLGQR